MNLDPHSLKRLQEIRRELPEKLSKLDSLSTKEVRPNNKIHAIETEEDPSTLFKELMQASPDGNVPKHMIVRLKEIEKKSLCQRTNEPVTQSTDQKTIKANLSSQQRQAQKHEEQSLYTSFKRLLLEEED